tara:strand:- start:1888 stop:2286 length:399 start_codon:yes stop_codon:yes gene_type:complete
MNKKVDILIVIINIIFFAYFAIQLIIFTDEFSINNLGFFNHAVAGLSEIIGIIFISFIIALSIIVFRGLERQLPFILIIFLFQFLAALNFWRYVFTDSPGETNLNTITINAVIFSIISFLNLILISKNINKI